MLALLAPLLALDIENLGRLKANLDEIINLHSHKLHSDEDGKNTQQSRASDPLQTEHRSWPKDCSEVSAGSPSGVYVIQPTGLHPIVVYCEMNGTDGGWTVIQRNHQSTEITWAESWSTYKYGFGNVHTEYWLGTEYIHQISKQKVYEVRFVIWDAANNTKFADYNLFSLEDESQGYRLRLGTYSGLAGDAMTSNSASSVHDNMKFSAKDLDQDTYSGNCASSYGGGWWYSACYSVRLNVKGGITWGSLCNGNCKASAIFIKPASYC
ncbi:fibrinogen-like protein 1-like protein [Sarcoramphus papa]